MKKKGLIISTIVMVVVLVASLTTATYAWFSSSGSATVSPVTLTTTATTDVFIGVEKDNSYDSTSNPNNFYSNNTTYTATPSGSATKWTGQTNGLGLTVNHAVNLTGLEKAVYSFTSDNAETPNYTMDAYAKGSGQAVTNGINMNGTIMKANGNGAGSEFDNSSVTATIENTDYLNIAFGAYAGKANVYAYGCLVRIHPTDELQSLGINAAIHVAYKLDGGSWVDLDAYGDSRYSTAKTTHGTPAMPQLVIASGEKAGTYTYAGVVPEEGDALVWIPLNSKTDSTFLNPLTDMKQLQLMIYVCGPDDDCITSAMGVSAEISINFISVNGTQAKD